jgi:uncharacterized RDD family membrane protein YckC
MNAITILNKDNVPTGPFTREQIEQKLKTGECALNDLAFMDGLAQWTPLGQILAKVDAAPSLSAPPVFAPTAAPIAGAPAYSYAATMQPPGHLVYAGFWLRFAAYMVDGLILAIPFTILCGILGAVVFTIIGVGHMPPVTTDSGSSQPPNPAMIFGIIIMELVIYAVLIVGAWLYFAKLESGPHQSTYGKRILGLKVTDLSGERLGFGRASGRFFGKIISGMTFYIGFIMAGFTEKKQALHDMIAGTLVVKK